MAKKKNAEEKRQEAEAKAAAKFFEREKAEYERRMKLAAETDNAKADPAEAEINGDDDENGDDEEESQDENSEEHKEGE